MAFRSSFASVPLQVTFAKGRKALAALTEHYVPCAAVRCSGYSCFQVSSSVTRQGLMSLSNRTSRLDIEHYFDIDSFTYEGTTIQHVTFFSHAPSSTRIDIEPRHRYEVIAPFMLDTGPIPSSIRTVRVTSSNRCQYFLAVYVIAGIKKGVVISA